MRNAACLEVAISNPTDVIVVGAGPTGLMAAALLARCGVSLRILSKEEGPTQESRAFGVQARSLELFLNMGMVDSFLERGMLATGSQIYVDGKQAAELNFDDIGRTDTPYSFVMMLPQREIEAILVDDLGRLGIEVEYGLQATDLVQDEHGVTVRAERSGQDPQDLRAAYLIGADGAHSLVRQKLGLTFEGAACPQGFLLADCKIDWPLDYSHLKLFLRGTHMAIYFPLLGQNAGRIIALSPGPVSQAEGVQPTTLDEVQSALREATGQSVTLSDPVWMSRYNIHHRGVDQYLVGRVFVAGDAAHIHSPAGGQGMNTGLQDAANLAWKLALVIRGKAPQHLLETYHSERWPVGQKVLHFTDRLFSILSSQKGWLAGIRNRLLPRFAGTVSRTGALRSKAFHFISQLGIRYRVPVFLHDDGPFKAVLNAGDRAPNASIARGLDVFALIQGYQFHLLAISRRPLGEEEIARLTQELAQLPRPSGIALRTHLIGHSLIGRDPRLHRCESSQVFQAFGMDDEIQQALFLIRPDGHICYRSLQLNMSGLKRFLRDRLGGSLEE
jgi:2-polyprenyl-6-methoxyphenol hydroxylase-like FAD-dependent oxidoreductase